jgi:hypothetical protein
MKKFIQVFIFIGCSLVCFPVLAEKVRQLSWDDLIPAHLLFVDLLANMTEDQQDLVIWVINTLETLPKRGPETEESYKEVDEAMPDLKKAGIDIVKLMAKYKEIRNSVVKALNGQQVRIPGYFLPLELSDTKVTEFLLVPYIGACIHVPPPPPNQIVHVRPLKKKGYSSKSLYEPVWVTGVITAKSMVKDLYLADGSTGVNIGYTMQAKRIEPYKE